MMDGKKFAANDFLFDGNIEGNCLLPSVIARADYLNKKVTKINFLLNLICKEKDFVFIDNRNINIDDLWENGLYLIEQGKAKLAQNFIHFSNSSYWQPRYYHSPREVMNLQNTKTNEGIVNKKTRESISASNSDKITADSIKLNCFNQIMQIKLFEWS